MVCLDEAIKVNNQGIIQVVTLTQAISYAIAQSLGLGLGQC